MTNYFIIGALSVDYESGIHMFPKTNIWTSLFQYQFLTLSGLAARVSPMSICDLTTRLLLRYATCFTVCLADHQHWPAVRHT